MDNMNSSDGFSVLDMAREMAANQHTDVTGLFAMNNESNIAPPPVPDMMVQEHIEDQSSDKVVVPISKKKKAAWVPDAELIADMAELHNNPVTYSKDEFIAEEQTELKNMLDEDAKRDSVEAMDEMSRTVANIEIAKQRHGISKFKIPEGEYHVRITAAAGDTNYNRAQAGLDELFNEIKANHPEFVLEWIENSEHKEDPSITSDMITEIPTEELNNNPAATSDDVTILIDKSKVSQVSWTQEELDKIKKARSVELNIVETGDLEYYNIKDADDNVIDNVLAQYQRKSNDVVSILPASKYRATFTGLSYPEVIDLSNSQELDNIDGELKKWSICFDHIRNQSIGPWREYQWYIDPNTKKRVEIPYAALIPPGIDEDEVHKVSKFEDFLMKTSFLDLEFMLWKILCATAMEKEVISVTCHADYNGKPCNKSYDWVYAPSDLIDMKNIPQVVLDEMKRTGEVSTFDDIMSNYKSSMLLTNNCVKLHTSGFKVVFGHISAYEYLNNVYGKIKELENAEDDPLIASKGMAYATLTVIKGFIVNTPDGDTVKISGVDNIVKVVNSLNEIDWQILSELVRIMIEPYTFSFSLKDLECPQCHTRSNINIESISRLLFIVARSLSSVQVVLKRT